MLTLAFFGFFSFFSQVHDLSAAEIYPDEVAAIISALMKHNTLESSKRALALMSLWRSAGRASEPAYLHYDAFTWNSLHKTPVIEMPQSKSSKCKMIPFMAGAHHHFCWLTTFGDYMAMLRGPIEYEEDKPNFLLPDLQGPNASTKMTNFIKALQPAGKPGAQKGYEKVAVSTLPPKPTAAGFRPGSCSTLAMYLPAEIAVHTTGHDLTGLSALWEYLNTHIALCIPGAIVLSGWMEGRSGQIGGNIPMKGAVPPSLLPITQVLPPGRSASMEQLENFADKLFSLQDGGPPMFRRGGSLRPMIHACLACLIMYYPERHRAGEVPTVLRLMMDCYEEPGVLDMPSTDDPHWVIVMWAGVVRARFEVDNAHLRAAQHQEGPDRIIAVLQQLGNSVARLSEGMSSLNATVSYLQQHIDTLMSQRDEARLPAQQRAQPHSQLSRRHSELSRHFELSCRR